MRAQTAVLVVAFLAACAGPGASTSGGPPASRVEHARPEADPALLGTPQGAPAVLPIEQIAVRVHRGPDGQVTIVEFLSPGLEEPDRVRLRLALEAGELRLAADEGKGEESWVTKLVRPPSH